MDLGDLYDAHARRLLVFFARRTYDSQLAMDLVAETFARAYEHRDGHRGTSQAEAVARVSIRPRRPTKLAIPAGVDGRGSAAMSPCLTQRSSPARCRRRWRPPA
jgi:hypothetical protein